jgi:hypothetical protein
MAFLSDVKAAQYFEVRKAALSITAGQLAGGV